MANNSLVTASVVDHGSSMLEFRAPLTFIWILLWLPFVCTASPPTAGSIETLLAVTDGEAWLDAAYAQVEPAMTRSVQRMVGRGKSLNPAQQRIVDQAIADAVATTPKMLSWDIVKSEMIRLHQELFTQEEIDAMIVYYQSPAGASAEKKMLVLSQPINAFVNSQLSEVIKDAAVAFREASAATTSDK